MQVGPTVDARGPVSTSLTTASPLVGGMRHRRPRQTLRPRWAVILPLLATLAFWCAVAAGVRRVLDAKSEMRPAVNGDLASNVDRDDR